MRILVFSGLSALFFMVLACDSKKDPTTIVAEDYSCIKLLDEQGQSKGIHGNCSSSGDFTNLSLTAREQALLNFSDTIGLAGTVSTPITYFGIAPNPVTIDKTMLVTLGGATTDQPVKLKLAIVDETFNVIQQFAFPFKTGQSILLHIDPAKYASGKYYRLYYQVSATGAPSLYQGYGNFLVCKTYIDGVNNTIESDCL